MMVKGLGDGDDTTLETLVHLLLTEVCQVYDCTYN